MHKILYSILNGVKYEKTFYIFNHFLIKFILKFLNLQSFKTQPFITLPGDNTGIDAVLVEPLNEYSQPSLKAYICWVNKFDSVYTLYLRQTKSDLGKNIIVYADTKQIENPEIAFESYYS